LTTGATYTANAFVGGTAAGGDRFGAALAAGDFNGDRIADLAIGIPGRTFGAVVEAGAVQIASGSADGISISGNQLLDEGSLAGHQQAFAHLGAVLAAGDFDGATPGHCAIAPADCVDDVAVGVPDEDVSGAGEAGTVIVGYGFTANGIEPASARSFQRSSFGQAVQAGEHFGAALAAGRQDTRLSSDFRHWPADLVIGVPFEDIFGANVGSAILLPGAPTRFSEAAAEELVESPGFASYPAGNNDDFGSAIAIGDFDGDGIGDLAIGIPGHTVSSVTGAGAVQILYGALFADGFESGSRVHWSNVSPH
jgi:hypothetical protein